jgi:hypothetical protein
MGNDVDGLPVVTLPERFDRRLRLGPFASARDALRFVTYAAVGAVAVPLTGAGVWLLVVAVGFTAVAVRPDGQALDERCLAFVLWKLRSPPGAPRVTAPAARRWLQRGLLTIDSGRFVAILSVECRPIAYLPPAELARRFELYRAVLRSSDGALALLVASGPMSSAPVRPTGPDLGGTDADARRGYDELVATICRRRQRRQVFLAVGATRSGSDGAAELELRATLLTDRLGEAGLAARRLRGGRLIEAGRRWGWT